MLELSEQIQRAIKEKSVIRFDYEGDACTVAPFSLGNIKQTLVLLAAAFEGESNIDERMNISGYTVSKMSGFEVTEDKFDVSKNLVPEIYLCGSIFDSTLCRVDTGKTMDKKA